MEVRKQKTIGNALAAGSRSAPVFFVWSISLLLCKMQWGPDKFLALFEGEKRRHTVLGQSNTSGEELQLEIRNL